MRAATSNLESGRRLLQGGPPKGHPAPRVAQRRNLSGKKDRRGGTAWSSSAPFLCPRECHAPLRPRLTPCTAPPGRRWWISAAGTCPSTTARRSRNITRCDATRACSTCRTCCAVDLSGADGARVPALRAGQQRRQARRARQGALLVPAERQRRRARRPDRLFPGARTLSASSSTPPPPTRTSHGSRRCTRERGQTHLAQGAARPRHVAVQGPNAREKLWQALPGSRAATDALKPFAATQFARLLHRPHRLHRRGRFRDHAAADSRQQRSGTHWSAPACGPAGSARATRCASRRA